MSVGWVAAGISAIGVISGMDAAEEAGDAAHQQNLRAQEAGNREQQLLEAQIRQADELLEFNRETYQDAMQRQERIDAINERVTNLNMDLSAKAGQRADEAYDFYRDFGRPVVQRTLQEAQDYDSAQNIEAARGRARADVQQAADQTAQQTQRALARLGVNPSSGRFLELQTRLQAENQLNVAQAMTGAEQGVRNTGIQLRQQASNLAQGFPAQSMGQAGQSSGFSTAGAGAAAATQAQNLGLSQQFMNGLGTAAGIYGGAANQFGGIASDAMRLSSGYTNMSNQLYGQAGQMLGYGVGSAMDAWRNFAPKTPSYIGSGMGASPGDPWNNGGNFADGGKIAGPEGGGGKVKGPGTGTSDSVPAVNGSNGKPIRLSNGEYVIPADVVEKMGTEYFDKMLAKHHKPVNMRSAA